MPRSDFVTTGLTLSGYRIVQEIGIATGIVAAVRRNRWPDLSLSMAAFVGISSPAFLTALLGLYV
ncbi:hypothetical protein J8J40_20425, partial [Mycobacterium tuberculosis]|nr:hypothetical protein [Mycobacterium tuberculosis]